MDHVLQVMKSGGGNTKYVLIHALSGLCSVYEDLVSAVDRDTDVWSLEANGIDGESEPLQSVPALGAAYARVINAQIGGGRLVIIGWSFGGLLAHETAKVLRTKGRDVRLVVLDCLARTERPSRHLITANVILGEMVRILYRDDPGEVERLALAAQEADPRDARAYVMGLILKNNPLLPVEVIVNLHRVLSANMIAQSRYWPSPVRGMYGLFLTAREQTRIIDDQTLGWQRIYPDGLDNAVVPGNHNSMLEGENGAAIAREITNWLRK